MASKEFINALKLADSEKLVESAYHNELRRGINSIGGQVESIKTLHGTDGVLDGVIPFDGSPRVLRIIIETKVNESFNLAVVRSKVLAQVVYYLKKFDDLGEQLPNVVLVGDVNECFVLHSNNLTKYLDRDYDWTIAPSSAGKQNLALVTELVEDKVVQADCFVYEINENFKFVEVIEKIQNLVGNVKTQVRITDRSISKVFDYFSMKILKKNSDGSSKYTAREQVEFFMHLVLNTDDCYLHPKKKDTALFNNISISVYSDAFDSFINYYKFDYNAQEKKEFTSIADRLIEDSDRRSKGDFYTPAVWVDETHKMLSENFGPTWKEDYMVWDCAWGTGNLTRDYKFFDLYCSSLHEHDLQIGAKYNQEAESKFQYDFLNDDVDLFDELKYKVLKGHVLTEADFHNSKLWKQANTLIRGLLNGKKLLFYINPPYGTAVDLRSISSENGLSKQGVALTKINELMVKNSIGAVSQQLYVQFLYRIMELKNLFNAEVSLALLSPPLIWTGSTAKAFRKLWKQQFAFKEGILFQASNFADVSDSWGISFTIFEAGVTNGDEYLLGLRELSEVGTVSVGDKLLYNMDSMPMTCSDWVKEHTKGLKTQDSVQMKGALTYHKEPKRGKLVKDALGYYVNVSNIVNENNQNAFVVSSCAAKANGISILPINFNRFVSNYTARRLLTGQYANWKNAKDEYMIPNTSHPLYQQWENDCIVYSLFNNASNQSSLRQIDYNGDSWDILNHFFFESKEEMQKLSLGVTPNDDVYHDIEEHGNEDRFVYTKLQGLQLSPDAEFLLDYARAIIQESFKYRKVFNQEHPEYHINTWDAGWYQIKGLLKEYLPADLKEFNRLYKEFEDRMRPLVYELGFLKE